MINTNMRKVFEQALYDMDGLHVILCVLFDATDSTNVHKSLIRL